MDKKGVTLKCVSFLSIMEWLEEIVVYQQQTGDTHLFSGFPAKVVKTCFSKETFTVTGLIDELQGCNGEQYSVVEIRSIVNNLMRKHLIVAC